MMNGTEWTKSLPACEPGTVTREALAAEFKERNRRVLEAVPNAFFNWCQITSEHRIAGRIRRLDMLVLGDSMRVGVDGDQVRPICTHPTAQRIADKLGALLPTEKICDLAWQLAAVRLLPATMTPDTRMATTARMLENSRTVDTRIQGAGFLPGGALFGSVSKIWACTNKLAGRVEASCNGGWQFDPNDPACKKAGFARRFRTPGGLDVLQPLATAHVNPVHGEEANHEDYSQKVSYLVQIECYLDGVKYSLEDVLRDPELCALASYEGPIKELRHPATTRGGAAPHPGPPHLGSHGELVVQWQKWLKVNGWPEIAVDGNFGPKTEHATREAQQRTHLPVSGVLDDPTQALMGPRPAELHAPSGPGPFDDDVARYPRTMNLVTARRRSKWYTPVLGERRKIRGVCIHTAEIAKSSTAAEAIAKYFEDPWTPGPAPGEKHPIKVSSHFVQDNDSTIQCVPIRDVAYTAPGANSDFVHVELCCFANQSRAQWDDEYSRLMLARLGDLIGALAFECQFQIAYLDETLIDPALGNTGITTHVVVSRFFKKSDHTDPGPNFPMERVLDLAAAAFGKLAGA